MFTAPLGRGRVVAIVPARNSAKTLEKTVAEIPPGCVDQIVLVDNASNRRSGSSGPASSP